MKLRGLITAFFFVASCAAAFGGTVVVPGTQTSAPGNLPVPESDGRR